MSRSKRRRKRRRGESYSHFHPRMENLRCQVYQRAIPAERTQAIIRGLHNHHYLSAPNSPRSFFSVAVSFPTIHIWNHLSFFCPFKVHLFPLCHVSPSSLAHSLIAVILDDWILTAAAFTTSACTIHYLIPTDLNPISSWRPGKV